MIAMQIVLDKEKIDDFRETFLRNVIGELNSSPVKDCQEFADEMEQLEIHSSEDTIHTIFESVNKYEWSEEVRYALSRALNDTAETVSYKFAQTRVDEETVDKHYGGSQFFHGPKEFILNEHGQYEIYCELYFEGFTTPIEVEMTLVQYFNDEYVMQMINLIEKQTAYNLEK